MEECVFIASPVDGEELRERGNEEEGKGEDDENDEEKSEAGRSSKEEAVASVCRWSSSLVCFTGCKATLTRVSLKGIEKGALLIENGADVVIDGVVFEANY